jgi:hypothetical protein
MIQPELPFTGPALRDAGMARAAEAQERETPFADAAYGVIVAIAQRQSTVHIDDVLSECTARPKHYNAWGAVWMRARRNQIIEHSGTVKPCMTDARKHSHQYPVYRSLVLIDK